MIQLFWVIGGITKTCLIVIIILWLTLQGGVGGGEGVAAGGGPGVKAPF